MVASESAIMSECLFKGFTSFYRKMKGEVLDYLRRGEPKTSYDKPCRRVLFVMSTEAETSLTIVTSVPPEFDHACDFALAAGIR